jgi:OOP family OmpA-OmpF porin
MNLQKLRMTLPLLILLATGCTHLPDTEVSSGAMAFPDAESAQWKEGSFPSLEALRTMRTGMGKDQVRGLLGSPHFSEGIANVREWNYLFHFRTGGDASSVTCQYQVQFDENMRTRGLFWKDGSCAGRVASGLHASPPA